MQRVDHLSRGIAPADSLRRQSVNLGECAGHKDIGRALRQFQPKVILVRLQIFGIRLIEHEQDVLWQRAMQTCNLIPCGKGPGGKIGRASCRERVCQYVWISVVDVSLKKKIQMRNSERSKQ